MTNVSQKCQYALRAMFELARRYGDTPTSVAEIAEVQAIPQRFLVLILGELRQGGFVESRRGARGGFLLRGLPETTTVGEIIRFVDGPICPVSCIAPDDSTRCPLKGGCAFMEMWERARNAVAEVYDNNSLQDLLDAQEARKGEYVADFCI